MKKITFTLAAILLLFSFSACGTKTENVKLEDAQDSLSWAMGMSLARTAKSGFYQFDEKVIRQAFESSLRGDKQPINEETYNQLCQAITFMAAQEMHTQSQAEAQAAQAKESEIFANFEQQHPNAKKAKEGYYYEVMQEGNGPKAKAGLRIKFDFRSYNMADNSLIEETYGQRDPIVHVIGRPMFEGLVYGLQQMNAGSKYRFYFPSKLVANAMGVPAHTPVIYEVELHEIYKD